jgi:hypothetical protein
MDYHRQVLAVRSPFTLPVQLMASMKILIQSVFVEVAFSLTSIVIPCCN